MNHYQSFKKELLLRIIFVWLTSLVLGDSFLFVFNTIFKLKGSIYLPLGFWAVNIYHGHFFIDNIVNMIPNTSELWLGLAIHIFLGLVFSFIFVWIIYVRFDFKHRFRDGLIYGLCLILFPLFIELPALGFGVLGIKMPNYFLVLSRTIIFHLIFGTGMALGLTLYTRIFQKQIVMISNSE